MPHIHARGAAQHAASRWWLIGTSRCTHPHDPRRRPHPVLREAALPTHCLFAQPAARSRSLPCAVAPSSAWPLVCPRAPTSCVSGPTPKFGCV